MTELSACNASDVQCTLFPSGDVTVVNGTRHSPYLAVHIRFAFDELKQILDLSTKPGEDFPSFATWWLYFDIMIFPVIQTPLFYL